jgi:hypothetical protein
MPKATSRMANQSICEKTFFPPSRKIRPIVLLLYKEYLEYMMYIIVVNQVRPRRSMFIATVKF